MPRAGGAASAAVAVCRPGMPLMNHMVFRPGRDGLPRETVVIGPRAAGSSGFRGKMRPLARGQHHHHLAAFHLWHGLYLGDFVSLVPYPAQHIGAKLLVGHFTTAETQCHLDLVTT